MLTWIIDIADATALRVQVRYVSRCEHGNETYDQEGRSKSELECTDDPD
jgi:hypothetical protein